MAEPLHLVVPHRLLADGIVGGVATVYRELAPRLEARGIRVTTISPNECRWRDSHVVAPDIQDPHEYAAAVAHIVHRLEPTVTECSSWEFELLEYARRSRPARAPVVVRSEFAVADMHAWHLVDGEGEMLRLADRILAVSRCAAKSLLVHYGDIPVPEVVHNGVDRSLFRPGPSLEIAPLLAPYVVDLLPDGSARPVGASEAEVRAMKFAGRDLPLLVWVGKATYMKGWPMFREITNKFAGRIRVLLILGHAPAFYPVDLPPSPTVLTVQDVPLRNMATLYSNADWYLCTSNAEGYGLAMAEAVSCGTPVLAPSALDVVWEFLEEGVDAVRYDSLNDLEHALSLPPPDPQGSRLQNWDDCADRSADVYAALSRQ